MKQHHRMHMTVIIFVLLLLMFSVACDQTKTQMPVSSEAPTQEQNEAEIQPSEDPYLEERIRMVEITIEARGVSDPNVLLAMRTVPRHKFVPEEYRQMSYVDNPLPIGYGQTISQPFIVAWMTELLDLKPGDKVLEIGTGSGYQAAILAELGDIEVYTIEIIPELAESAALRFKNLGYSDIRAKQADGYFGWSEYAPFDAIIVTAAPDHLPPLLIEQLADNGRLVIPIGPPGSIQTLWKFVVEQGEVIGYNLGGVTFVPFTGEVLEHPSKPGE